MSLLVPSGQVQRSLCQVGPKAWEQQGVLVALRCPSHLLSVLSLYLSPVCSEERSHEPSNSTILLFVVPHSIISLTAHLSPMRLKKYIKEEKSFYHGVFVYILIKPLSRGLSLSGTAGFSCRNPADQELLSPPRGKMCPPVDALLSEGHLHQPCLAPHRVVRNW